MTEIVEYSVLTCPHCGARDEQRMPTNQCVIIHECTGCEAMLRPRPGDCCVYCSFGSLPCPPVQESRAAGSVSKSCC